MAQKPPGWKIYSSKVACLLLLIHFGQVGANVADMKDALDSFHRLLQVGEELHRTFQTRREVDVARLRSLEGSMLCAGRTRPTLISRKLHEDSWTDARSPGGAIESRFNGNCFMKFAGICISYQKCSTVSEAFDAGAAPLEGIHWASNQSQVISWQREQLSLLEKLLETTSDTSQLERDLNLDITGAAERASTAITQLRSILDSHREAFSKFVSPVGEARSLPSSLQALATALKELVDNNNFPSLSKPHCGKGWLQYADTVANELDGQDEVLRDIDATAMLQLEKFHYAQRAVEALEVAAALSLQAGALAAISDLNCNVKLSARTALPVKLDKLQKAVNGLMQKVSDALPYPKDQSATDWPLRRCFANRLKDAWETVPATGSALPTPLMSLDSCRHIFQATFMEKIAIVPNTSDAPSASSTELISSTGELRKVHADNYNSWAFVTPFATFARRSFGDAARFVPSDHVIELHHVQDMNVRKGGKLPTSNKCSEEQKATLFSNANPTTLPPCTSIQCSESSCDVPGCFVAFSVCSGWDGGRHCSAAPVRMYTDGVDIKECDKVTGSHHFYQERWANSSCPFVCEEADRAPDGRACLATPDGYFSATCSNVAQQCSIPAGVQESSFKAVANFSSPGNGHESGCEVTLAFPMAMPPAASVSALGVSLDPPFTAQLYVNLSITDIPPSSESWNRLAILMGSFPNWYMGIGWYSSSSVQLVFYHSKITLTAQGSAAGSIIRSDPIEWGKGWRHVAVVVSEFKVSTDNIAFYVDGSLVSSGSRRVSATEMAARPHVHPDHNDIFHVGPGNLRRFPEVLRSGRPYWDLPLFTAQVDELRVSKVALDSFSLGSQLPELRRHAACSPPYERIDGSTCAAVARLTPPNTSASQTACSSGYEECGAMPGICMLACSDGMLRQADCSCDCKPAHVQAWLIQAVRLTGSGVILNATVYSTEHKVIGRFSGGLLPARIDLGSWAKVAVIAVQGGGSATMVSVEVETPAPESKLLVVPSLQDVPLLADREVLLHHAQVLKYDDPSLTCALCPGVAPRSKLPRSNAMDCRCAKGYGPDLLGKCVPLKGPLPIPIISLQNGSYYTAGTRVRLSLPALPGVKGPWLAEIRYVYGTSPQAPSCDLPTKYEEPNDGSSPGLDIIRRQQMVDIRAVVCHPTHQISLEARAKLYGNDHMNPPRCIVQSGNMSTATAYALELQVALRVDLHPDANIKYQLNGASTVMLYEKPVLLAIPGSVLVSTWAEKHGFDRSATNICSYSIDGPARMSVQLRWPALKPGDEEQLGGYVEERAAFLVRRGLEVLRFGLEVSSLATTGVQLQYRLKRGELAAYGDWLPVPANKLLSLTLSEQLQPPNTTTVLRVEWRAKEPGYVWTDPDALQVLLLATRTRLPSVEAEPTHPWALGDAWFEGPLREKSLRQVHRITLGQPSFASRLFYSVRTSMGQAAPASGAFLLTASKMNVSSVSKGGLVEEFKTITPHADLRPDDMPSTCGGLDQSSGSSTPVPLVCAYLGPFEVLGGAVVTAFAVTAGELESELVTLTIPKEREAPAESTFVAAPVDMGNVVAVRSRGWRVLPSASRFLTFSLGQEDAERQSCVLASAFSQGNSSQVPQSHKSLHNCSWLPYNGERKLDLGSLMLQAGLAEKAEDSLNITVLSTVKRPGFLWSFPNATTYLWLRERAAMPRVIQIRQPGPTATLATMVWLQHPASSDLAPNSFFTLNDVSLNHAEMSAQFLREVPDLAAQVDALPAAFRPTQKMTNAQRVSNWKTNISECKWPSLCPLAVFSRKQTHFSELIYVPSSFSWLCAWAVWGSYSESKPGCKLLGPAEDQLTTKPTFPSSIVTKQGYDQLLGADILSLAPTYNKDGSGRRSQTSGRRLAGGSITSLPISLPRSHPVQYRYGAKCLDPHLLKLNISKQELLDGMQHLPFEAQSWSSGLSPWRDLDMVGEDPTMPVPACYPHEHALFAVSSRLLTGLDQWSFETQSRAVLLLGSQVPVSIVNRQRSLVLSVPSPGQSRRRSVTVFYRWFPGASSQPVLASNGGPIVQLQTGSVLQAYAVDEGVLRQMRQGAQDDSRTDHSQFVDLKEVWGRNQLEGVHKSWSCTAPAAGSESAQVEAALGPHLCAWEGAKDVRLPIPSSAGWTLWAAAFSTGLPLSVAKSFSVGAQCQAPKGIAFASATASCREGVLVDNSSRCSTACQAGYAPSVAQLTCVDGAFQPPTFTCAELHCQAPSDVLLAASSSCAEGPGLIAPGSQCTPSCQAGYVSNSSTALQCSAGVLSPATFSCIEASCSAPSDVVHAASPSCSGVGVVKSGEACVPQCRTGYVPSEKSLDCRRGELSPAAFECHPGVDTGLLVASIPSGIVAGSLALFAVLCCYRHPKRQAKSVEQPGPGDPIQDWLDCVKEVEPGTCVFCGDKPEELESTLDDHGPPTLFFCCSSCAATLGAEESPDEDPSEQPKSPDEDPSEQPTDDAAANSTKGEPSQGETLRRRSLPETEANRTQGESSQGETLRRRNPPQPEESTSEVPRHGLTRQEAVDTLKFQQRTHRQEDPERLHEAPMPNLLRRDMLKQQTAELHHRELPEKRPYSFSHQEGAPEQNEPLHLHKIDARKRDEDETVHCKREHLEPDDRQVDQMHQRHAPDQPRRRCEPPHPSHHDGDPALSETVREHRKELAELLKPGNSDGQRHRVHDSEEPQRDPDEAPFPASQTRSLNPETLQESAFHMHERSLSTEVSDQWTYPVHQDTLLQQQPTHHTIRLKLPKREGSDAQIHPDSPAEREPPVKRNFHGHRAERREQNDESPRILDHEVFSMRGDSMNREDSPKQGDSTAHQIQRKREFHQEDEPMHNTHRDDNLGEDDRDASERRGNRPTWNPRKETLDKRTDTVRQQSSRRQASSDDETNRDCHKSLRRQRNLDQQNRQTQPEGARKGQHPDQPYLRDHDRVQPRDVHAEEVDWQELGQQIDHPNLPVLMHGSEGRRQQKPVVAERELRSVRDLNAGSPSPRRRGPYGMHTELEHRTPSPSPPTRRARSIEMTTELGSRAPATSPTRRRTRSTSRPAHCPKSKGGRDDLPTHETFDSGSTKVSTRLPSVQQSSRSDSSSGMRQKGSKKVTASGGSGSSNLELQNGKAPQRPRSPTVQSPQRAGPRGKKAQQRPKTWAGHPNCYDSTSDSANSRRL